VGREGVLGDMIKEVDVARVCLAARGSCARRACVRKPDASRCGASERSSLLQNHFAWEVANHSSRPITTPAARYTPSQLPLHLLVHLLLSLFLLNKGGIA
jgi:hypothetical protein